MDRIKMDYFDESPIQIYLDTPNITWYDQVIRNDISIKLIILKEFREENKFMNYHFSISISPLPLGHQRRFRPQKFIYALINFIHYASGEEDVALHREKLHRCISIGCKQ